MVKKKAIADARWSPETSVRPAFYTETCCLCRWVTFFPDMDVAGADEGTLCGVQATYDDGEEVQVDSMEETMSVVGGPYAEIVGCGTLDDDVSQGCC